MPLPDLLSALHEQRLVSAGFDLRCELVLRGALKSDEVARFLNYRDSSLNGVLKRFLSETFAKPSRFEA